MKQDWKPGTMIYPLPAVMVIIFLKKKTKKTTLNLSSLPPP